MKYAELKRDGDALAFRLLAVLTGQPTHIAMYAQARSLALMAAMVRDQWPELAGATLDLAREGLQGEEGET